MWFSDPDWENTGSSIIESGSYTIKNCTISDCSYGIRIFDIQAGEININDNNLIEWTNPNTDLNSPGKLRGSGIHISNGTWSADQELDVLIADNQIKDAWRGIHLENLSGLDWGYDINTKVWVHDNVIEIHQPEHPDLCWAPYAGIQVDNGLGITLEENHIYSDTDFGWDWTADGIRSYNAYISDYVCNDINDMGSGFHIIEANSFTQLVNNEMENLLTGVVYDRGITGDQGNPDFGNGNHWAGTNWNTPGWELVGYTPLGSAVDYSNSDWYTFTYTPFVIGNVDYVGSGFVQGLFEVNPQVPTSAHPPSFGMDVCNTATYPRSDSTTVTHRDSMYVRLIRDTIPTSLEDSTLYWNKYYSMYHILLKDTAVTNNDTLLSNLRDSLHDADIGLVYRTFEVLGDTATSTATYSSYQDSLAKESTDFVAAEGLVDYLDWLTDLRANEDTLETADVNDLITIAEKCPYTEGFSVILARALLKTVDSLSFKEYTDTCELIPDSLGPGPSYRYANPEADDVQSEVQQVDRVLVFPNPATDEVTVILPEEPEVPWSLQLTGLSGKVLRSFPLYQQKQHVKLTGLAAGLYYLQIYDEKEGQRYVEKLVILDE
jgi:hypothetical protein